MTVIDGFHAKIQFVENELVVLKKVVVQSMLDESDAPMKVSVPKLKNFKGVNNAKDLENFF